MPSRHPSQVFEEQRRILRQIEKLARYPFALAAMVSLGQEYQPSFQSTEEKSAPRPIRHARNNVSKAVTRVALSFKTEFTNADVREKLANMGHRLSAKNQRSAINRILLRLVKEGKLTEIKKGAGGALSVYKVAS